MKKCFTIILFCILLPLLAHDTLEIEKQKNKLNSVTEIQDKMYIYYNLAKLSNDYSYQQAMCYADSSLQIATELDNHDFGVTLKLYQGDLLFMQNKYLQAYKNYQESLAEAIKSKNQENQIESLSKLAIFNYRITEFNKSIQFCNQALNLISDEESIEAADLYFLLGKNYKDLYECTTALNNFKRSYDIYKRNNDLKHCVSVLISISQTYLDMKDYDAAIKISFEGIEISTLINEQWPISLCNNDIAWAYYKKGDFDKALTYNNLSLDIRRSEKIYYAVQSSLINIASLYKNFNNPDKAIELLHEALEGNPNDNDERIKHNERRCYQHLSELYLEKHDFEQAFKYLTLFNTMDDSLTNAYNLNEVSKLDAKFYIEYLENKQLVLKKAQRQKQLIILFFILAIFLIIIYFIYSKYVIKQKQNITLQKEIIEREKIETELKSSKNSLKILNKIIRHDVTNDLAVIKSALNLFKRNSNKEMLDEIGRRVLKIIDQISYYKTYESFIDDNSELIKIEISELIGDLIKEFPNLEISLEGSGIVIADSAMYSVFSNMITNSINHGKATQIKIKVSSIDMNLRIDFCDNGGGIPENLWEKIFEEGFIYGDTGHTGIGLHIVKQTIQRYGGKIWVEANEPQGTVFVILLKKFIQC